MLYNVLSFLVWFVVMSKPPVKPPNNQEELPLKYVYGVGLIGLVFALIFMSFFYFATH